MHMAIVRIMASQSEIIFYTAPDASNLTIREYVPIEGGRLLSEIHPVLSCLHESPKHCNLRYDDAPFLSG